MSDLNEVLDNLIKIGKTKRYSLRIIEGTGSREAFFFDREKNCYAQNLNHNLTFLLPDPNSKEFFFHFLKNPIRTLTYIYYHAEMVGKGRDK